MPSGDVDGYDRTRHGVEARGEDDRVELERLAPGVDPVSVIVTIGFFRRSTSRTCAGVVGLVVVGVEARAFGAEGMISWTQRLGSVGIVNDQRILFRIKSERSRSTPG
jgi:hypothetical protein